MPDAPKNQPQPSAAMAEAATSPRRTAEVEHLFSAAKEAVSLGHFDQGLALLDQAESLAGPLPQLGLTRVNTLRQARRWPEAVTWCRALLGHHPNNTEAHLALGFIHLLQGQWLEGWREREWRWLLSDFRTLIPPQMPIWEGSHQPRTRLWVRCEQGFGDFLQFCRLLPLAAARVGSVVVTVPPSLLRLARSSLAPIDVVPEGATPKADAWVSLMSLPDRLQWIPPETAPAPYLQIQPSDSSTRPERLGPIRRIGWVSTGNPNHFNDRNRSLNAEALAEFRLPASVTAYRVQPEARLSDALPFALHAPEIALSDFYDTARWLEALDLIITVDTSVAHLAGALGIPVWILLPYAPDWRWGTQGETTRWYRSARLIRQPRPNDWRSALEQVQRGLESAAA
jgi:hypothetical protein